MPACHTCVHAASIRVLRVEPDCPPEMIKRQVWLSEPNSYPSAEEPCPGHIRINGGSPIDKIASTVQIADNEAQSNPGRGQGPGIVWAQLDCPACQSLGLGRF